MGARRFAAFSRSLTRAATRRGALLGLVTGDLPRTSMPRPARLPDQDPVRSGPIGKLGQLALLVGRSAGKHESVAHEPRIWV